VTESLSSSIAPLAGDQTSESVSTPTVHGCDRRALCDIRTIRPAKESAMSARARRCTPARLFAAISVLTAALLTIGVIGAASPASAFTFEAGTYGTHGKVSQAGAMLRAVGVDRGSIAIEAAALTLGTPVFDTGVVQGDERVTVQYTLQSLDDGAWRTSESSPYYARTIGPGASQTFPAHQFGVAHDDARRHEYRIVVTAWWLDVTTGYPMGQVVIAPAAWGDTMCETSADVHCEPVFGGLSVIGESAL
jgi:hypothetical protein